MTTAIEVVRDPVAVLVQPIAAFCGVICARRTVVVVTVRQTIAIVIDSVSAKHRAVLGDRILSLIAVLAVGLFRARDVCTISVPILVVVPAVTADLCHRRNLDIEGVGAFVWATSHIHREPVHENEIGPRGKNFKIQG